MTDDDAERTRLTGPHLQRARSLSLGRCWNWLVQRLAVDAPAVPPCWYQ